MAIGAETRANTRAIDLVHLSRQTCGDRDLEREVLALFRDQCARLLKVIAAEGGAERGRTAAHTLKGAARGVGAFAVADCAEVVEKGPPDWLASLDALQGAVREAQAVIDGFLADA